MTMMIMKLFLLLAALMATSSSAYVCKVCGANWTLTTHTATYNDPKNATKTCGELRREALAGLISETDCPTYPPLLQKVCCKRDSTPPPTPAPTVHTPRPSTAVPKTPSTPTSRPKPTTPAPTPGRMTNRPTVAESVSQKKDTHSVSDAPPAKSTGNGNSTNPGVALMAVGGVFAALVVLLVVVIAVTQGRKKSSTPRTADTAGASLDPDGSTLNKYSDTPDPSIASASESVDPSGLEDVTEIL